MTDLSTSYLGLSLSNPLVVSASPLSQDVAQIEKMANMGAAAVVLPSLFEEQLTAKHEGQTPVPSPGPEGAPDAATPPPDLASYNAGPKGYLEHIRRAKAAVAIPIIASLNATTPGTLGQLRSGDRSRWGRCPGAERLRRPHFTRGHRLHP